MFVNVLYFLGGENEPQRNENAKFTQGSLCV